MIHTRDLSAGYTAEQLTATREHVRDHLAAVADPDDNPAAYLESVEIVEEELPYGGLRIIGRLEAEPNAPYLQSDYDPDEAQRAGL